MQERSLGIDKSRLIAAVLLAASLSGLAAAFIGEHLFGLEPCILCLYERVPHGVVAVLALSALVPEASSRWRVLFLGVAAVVLALSTALAFYHVGVEEHWWGSVADCGGELATGSEAEDLHRLSAADLRPCDQVDWRLFGVSLAGYNAAYSLILAGICAVSVAVSSRKA